jgi:hypothetical protein
MVNWLTATQSLLAGTSKSMTRACAPAADLAPVLDRDAIDQHPVHRAVALHQRRRIAARELAVGIAQGVGRKVGIQPHERLPQPPLQQNVAAARIAALGAGFARGDVRSVQHRVAERMEPGEGGVLDDGFGESDHVWSY